MDGRSMDQQSTTVDDQSGTSTRTSTVPYPSTWKPDADGLGDLHGTYAVLSARSLGHARLLVPYTILMEQGIFVHSTRTNLRGVNRLYLVRKKRMRSRTGTIKAHNLS